MLDPRGFANTAVNRPATAVSVSAASRGGGDVKARCCASDGLCSTVGGYTAPSRVPNEHHAAWSAGRRGAAIAELAIVLRSSSPVFSMVDFGIYSFAQHTLQFATREGVRLALGAAR